MKPCAVGCWRKDCGTGKGSERTLPTERAQSALWRTGAAGRELSRLAGAAWAAGLGDPPQWSFSPTAAWAAALWAYAKQGPGLRRGGRNDAGVLPRGADSLYRTEG